LDLALMSSVRVRQEQLQLVYEILRNTDKYKVSYLEQDKANIELHLQQLLTKYVSLYVKYEDYTYNDGRTIGLIKLEGTVPILFMQVKYNIPVTLWISERYPQDPPIAYVTPTPHMVIKNGHKYVDKSGMVRTPYFNHWQPQMSDLVGLVMNMADEFGKDPPLYARTPQPPPGSRYPAVTSTTSDAHPHGFPPGSSSGANAGVYSKGQMYQDPAAAYAQKPKPKRLESGGAIVRRLKSQCREAMIKAIEERLSGSVAILSQECRPRKSKAEEDNTILAQRKQQIESGIAMLQAERQTYEQNVQTMADIVSLMEKWRIQCGSNQHQDGSEQKAEDVIVPLDPLNEQMLKAQSEDLAPEDSLNALDKLLQKEIIDLDTYLKQIRQVCRPQYFARALTMKIGEMHHRPQ